MSTTLPTTLNGVRVIQSREPKLCARLLQLLANATPHTYSIRPGANSVYVKRIG